MIYITGTTGYIGSKLKDYLKDHLLPVKAVTREELEDKIMLIDEENTMDISNIFVNCAGVAHKDVNRIGYSEELYSGNVKLVDKILEKALSLGCSTFINISSISVYGKNCENIDDHTEICPDSLYSYSKLAGELLVRSQRKIESRINVRVPMVYGPDCPGNFSKLLKISKSNLPVPLKRARHKKSLLYIYNLCESIRMIVLGENKCDSTYLISDDYTLSTYEIYKKYRASLNKQDVSIALPMIIHNKLIRSNNAYYKMHSLCTIDTRKFERDFGKMRYKSKSEALEMSFGKEIRGLV